MGNGRFDLTDVKWDLLRCELDARRSRGSQFSYHVVNYLPDKVGEIVYDAELSYCGRRRVMTTRIARDDLLRNGLQKVTLSNRSSSSVAHFWNGRVVVSRIGIIVDNY